VLCAQPICTWDAHELGEIHNNSPASGSGLNVFLVRNAKLELLLVQIES
jgi:hypothetical protein